MKEDVKTVFDFWNNQNIIKHRDISKFQGSINGRLKFYSCSEICQAIQNYSDILFSKNHYFSYSWTLSDFLTRKNALDVFLNREHALNRFKTYTRPIKKESPDRADFYRELNNEVPE